MYVIEDYIEDDAPDMILPIIFTRKEYAEKWIESNINEDCVWQYTIRKFLVVDTIDDMEESWEYFGDLQGR